MSGERVRIAVIGAGGISQQMHLPHLAELGDRYEVAAVCDVSATLAALGAQRFGATAHTEHRTMLRRIRPDAVLIAINGPPEDVVISALEAGAHVFVEKPLAWSAAQAARVESAVERTGRVLVIGYMKRYDPAVELAQRLLDEMGPVRGGIVRCVAGPNARYFKDVITVVGANDLPPETVARLSAVKEKRLEEALGDAYDDPGTVLAYQLLVGISCHELSVLRGLLGSPLEVSSAQISHDGRWVTATLRYPSGSIIYTLGRVTTRTFDERFELYADEATLELSFPSPFLEHAPTLLKRRREDGAGVSVEERIIASYEEPFRRELEHFHDCVAHGAAPRTPASEGRGDAEILQAIVRAAHENAAQRLTAEEIPA
jgi:predicted dehydrogenase